MTALAAASAACAAVLAWLMDLTWWYPSLGWAAGLIMRNPAAMAWGIWTGTALAFYQRAAQHEARRDRDEQEALLFIIRLRQLLTVKGTLAGALDALGYRSGWQSADASEHVLVQAAGHWRIHALSFAARAAAAVRKHGGELGPLLDWAADAIQKNQSRREARRLEEGAQRATMLVLALAPWGVVAVLRLLVPSFYRALNQTTVGTAALLAVGCTTTIVFVILSLHIEKEARIR